MMSCPKVLLGLIHHDLVVMRVYLVVHRGSDLHGAAQGWVCRERSTALYVPTLVVNTLNPGIAIKFASRWSKLRIELQNLCQNGSRACRDMIRNYKIIFHNLLVKVLIVLSSVGEASTEEGK